MSKIMLKKPILINGEDVKEIDYDLDEMTGENLENAFKTAIKDGYIIGASYELDPVIGAYIFAEAAGIDYRDVKRFSLIDYNNAASEVRSFFIKGLGGAQEENN